MRVNFSAGFRMLITLRPFWARLASSFFGIAQNNDGSSFSSSDLCPTPLQIHRCQGTLPCRPLPTLHYRRIDHTNQLLSKSFHYLRIIRLTVDSRQNSSGCPQYSFGLSLLLWLTASSDRSNRYCFRTSGRRFFNWLSSRCHWLSSRRFFNWLSSRCHWLSSLRFFNWLSSRCHCCFNWLSSRRFSFNWLSSRCHCCFNWLSSRRFCFRLSLRLDDSMIKPRDSKNVKDNDAPSIPRTIHPAIWKVQGLLDNDLDSSKNKIFQRDD